MQGSQLSPITRNTEETTPMHNVIEFLKTSKDRKPLKGKKGRKNKHDGGTR